MKVWEKHGCQSGCRSECRGGKLVKFSVSEMEGFVKGLVWGIGEVRVEGLS